MKPQDSHDADAPQGAPIAIIREDWVRHDGIDFHLLTAGPDDGREPALILLHGGGSRADYFRDLMMRLGNDRRVVAFDQRAFGQTKITDTTPVDHARWASDVLGVMDAIGIGKAALLGWSMGATVAINAAWLSPERIAQLILLGGPDPDNGVNVARLRERQVETADLDAAAIKARDAVEIAAALGPAARARPALIERLVEDRAATPPARAALAIGGYASRPDLAARLAALACPVAIIGGSEDSISTPAVIASLAAHIPQSRVTMLEGCGHYHVAEEPDAIARIVSAELGVVKL